jgi:F0F1-type ATP synthase assembly protein I
VSGPPDAEAQEKQRAARRQGIAYQGATEAFVAILLCMGLGYWADSRYGTSPTFVLIGTGIGFGAFILRLVRLGRQIEKLRVQDDASPPTRNPQ